MLLARESLDLDHSLQHGRHPPRDAAARAGGDGNLHRPIEDRPLQVRVSPDGRTIAVSTNNNMMRFYDTRTHRQVRAVPLINADYTYVPSTGQLFAAAPESPPAYRLLDPRTGHALGAFVFSKLWQTHTLDPIRARRRDSRTAVTPS